MSIKPPKNYHMHQYINKIIRSHIIVFLFLSMTSFFISRNQIFLFASTGLVVNLIITTFLYLFINKIKRAFVFHFTIYILSTLLVAFLLGGSSIIIAEADRSNLIWFYIISFLIAIGGSYNEINSIQAKLKDSFSEQINRGRLNIKDGYWDLGVKLEFVSIKQKDQNRLLRLSPIVTALVFMLARIIEGDLQIYLIGMGFYVLGFIILWDYTKHLAFYLQLKNWENDNNINIYIR